MIRIKMTMVMMMILLSAVEGPGASDNMLNCAIMLEVKNIYIKYLILWSTLCNHGCTVVQSSPWISLTSPTSSPGGAHRHLEKSRTCLRLDLPLQRGRGVRAFGCAWLHNQASVTTSDEKDMCLFHGEVDEDIGSI